MYIYIYTNTHLYLIYIYIYKYRYIQPESTLYKPKVYYGCEPITIPGMHIQPIYTPWCLGTSGHQKRRNEGFEDFKGKIVCEWGSLYSHGSLPDASPSTLVVTLSLASPLYGDFYRYHLVNQHIAIENDYVLLVNHL